MCRPLRAVISSKVLEPRRALSEVAFEQRIAAFSYFGDPRCAWKVDELSGPSVLTLYPWCGEEP